MKPLGRKHPGDMEHVAKYPYKIPKAVDSVNKILALPFWHKTHDQGNEGSCVGHAAAMERAIVNTAQRKLAGTSPYTRRYDPLWIWNEAKQIDEWPDTNPGDANGTSVRAAYDVLRTKGARRIKTSGIVLTDDWIVKVIDYQYQPSLNEGILENRWARTVDEMRTAIAQGASITIGVNWYTNFDNPQLDQSSGHYWIGRSSDLGSIRGGHAVCIYGASDRRQAFRMKNSWGEYYPLVWLPYSVMQRLLNEWGEATLVTDR